MIHRQKGRYVLECDTCEKLFEGNLSEEYTDFWNRAEAEGWEARQVSGQWVHVCPWCGSPGSD
jgi:hypothetical protein